MILEDLHSYRDACRGCGECLVNCRYMRFTRDQAVEEIRKINRGETASSRAVRDCMSCYACNRFCPNDAHPYERIHFAWDARYRQEGLPMRASYLMPGRRPNFRQDLPFSARERELHARWASDMPPARTCLYPGCNLLAMPLLATGAIFEVLPVWGRWDLCCGEMFFRMGLVEPVRGVAERLSSFYRDKPIDELVFVCPAGYNMFSHVLPEQFGAKFPFKITFFTDWFDHQLSRGRFNLSQGLSDAVVVHDSCHGRILGDAFMNGQREFLRKLGLRIHETGLNRTHGLCCGVAAGCNRYSLIDLVRWGYTALHTLEKAEGDEIAVYCTGCLLTLNIFHLLNPFGKRLVHLIEYTRAALGERVERRHTVKAVQMAAGIGIHALPHYLNPKRIKIS
ncbi:MAG: (Fe-S)-binding protein [Desulfobacteraceae bacterium]|nr:(Fe-S)-binding protein [Desulfobacteraceae bacterium]